MGKVLIRWLCLRAVSASRISLKVNRRLRRVHGCPNLHPAAGNANIVTAKACEAFACTDPLHCDNHAFYPPTQSGALQHQAQEVRLLKQLKQSESTPDPWLQRSVRFSSCSHVSRPDSAALLSVLTRRSDSGALPHRPPSFRRQPA